MKLKTRRLRGDLQDYHNQRYIAHLLDDGVFDATNVDGDTTFLYHGGAPDAPDYMPAGSMVSVFEGSYDRSTCERGVSLKEQNKRYAFIMGLLT